MIRTLVVSSIRLYALGVQRLFECHSSVEIVGVVHEYGNVLAQVEALRPDVTLIDRSMKECLKLTRLIVAESSRNRVVIVSLTEGDGEVISCIEAGACGYVFGAATLEELVSAVESASRGEFRCPASDLAALTFRLNEGWSGHTGRGQPPELDSRLTAREQEVLEQLQQGRSNKGIAYNLNIELATVKNHVHNILDKLGASSRGEAVARFRGQSPVRGLALEARAGAD